MKTRCARRAVPPAKTPLRALYLYLTSSCNLRCRHCWVDPDPAPARLRPSVPFSRLTRAVTEACALGLASVKLTGGEPFLYPRVCDLLGFLSARNLRIMIETNGTLIGDREAAAIRDARVASVSVSLDGPTAAVHDALRGVPGSFDRAIAGIRCMQKRCPGTPLHLVFSLWKGNVSAVGRMIPFARSLGVSILKINGIEAASGRGRKMEASGELLSAREVLAVSRRIGRAYPAARGGRFNVFFDVPPAFVPLGQLAGSDCSTLCGVRSLASILADGTISVCGIGKTVPALSAGNISSDRIADAWGGHPLFAGLRDTLPAALEGVCGRCMMKAACLGKCRAAAYFRSGSLYAPFPFCQSLYEQGRFPGTRLAARENRRQE